ncbi:MAG: tRNA (N(6)-L-threonylcarbamoyladenosine(37)-C(2))-methylthiotransferase MtaB, partial [candidate division WOR-3 bacterium]
ADRYRRRFLGKSLWVLWESTDQLSDLGWQMEGLSDNYLRVTAFAPKPRWNQIDKVRVTALEEDGLKGVIQ